MDRANLTEEILAYLDGQLSQDEERALAARVRGDEEAEKLLADLMRLHASVAAVLQERTGETAARREMSSAPTPPGGVPRVRRGGHRFQARGAAPESTAWMFAVGGALAACLLIAIAVSVPGRETTGRTTAGKPSPKPTELPAPPEPAVREEKLPPKPPPPPAIPDPVPLPQPPPRSEPPTKPEAPPPPAPRPEEPRPSPAPPRATVAEEKPKAPAALAQLERVKGEVHVRGEGAEIVAGEGRGLLSGQSLLTVGAESAAVLKYADGTQIELAGDTRLSQIIEAPTGRKSALDQGAITAKVSKQPSGQAMIFMTPHAEARVLGTALKLSVDPQGTKLEVTEGRVRLTRRQDGASVEVGAGFYAVAGPGPRPLPRKIGTPLPGRLYLLEDFEDAASLKARWQTLEGGFPATTAGALDLDVSPRPGDSYAGGGWHLAGGLRTRQAFPLPLRVSLDIELTQKDDNVNALVVFAPAGQKGGVLKNEIAVRLRGAEYAVLIEGQKAKSHEISWKPPLHERWTLELDRAEVKLFADGKEVQRHAHGLSITEDYRVELQGSAKLEAPKGSRVRFDNVKIEP